MDAGFLTALVLSEDAVAVEDLAAENPDNCR